MRERTSSLTNTFAYFNQLNSLPIIWECQGRDNSTILKFGKSLSHVISHQGSWVGNFAGRKSNENKSKAYVEITYIAHCLDSNAGGYLCASSAAVKPVKG
ncbi:hypothetical protein EMCG_03560 [[Emmonsia] crescens]|uniref:Uncharacterized protein n=1 Tax=[Emmonsia] crescens TaxID=73230 RepID=A0A0G2HUV2_9EURO|nr:hypothetical protein EMCG_03560 [Emmonsia crescens UAMH 3008]